MSMLSLQWVAWHSVRWGLDSSSKYLTQGELGAMSPWNAPLLALIRIYKEDFCSQHKASVQHCLATQGRAWEGPACSFTGQQSAWTQGSLSELREEASFSPDGHMFSRKWNGSRR